MWRARRHAEEAARSAWLDAAAMLEARSRTDFKHVQDVHLSLVDTLSELRADFARRDYQLTNTLAQLSSVCTTMVERIESDREERRELVQTITDGPSTIDLVAVEGAVPMVPSCASSSRRTTSKSW